MKNSEKKTDILFELGCEELPPLSLYSLAESLYRSVIRELEEADLSYFEKQSNYYATPRRLAFVLKGVEIRQRDKSVQKRGPALKAAYDGDGNPTPAALGFAGSLGLKVDDLTTVKTDKGEWLAADIIEKGQAIEKLLPDMLSRAIKQLPIPKPMHWSDHQYAFIRPVHWLVLMMHDEVIPYELFGIKSDRFSRGHRFYSDTAVKIKQVGDYEKALEAFQVIVDQRIRVRMIEKQVNTAVEPTTGKAMIKESLLREVSAITEFPNAVLGNFEKAYLSVPAEALISSMEKHQKYFPVSGADGDLLPYFVAVANIDSKRPEEMIKGFEKVIKPRLADAVFFWEKDKKRALEKNIPLLKKMIFEKTLGTIFDKSNRVSEAMRWLSQYIPFEIEEGKRAALLMKTDLMSDMVGEFPDLQGKMGGYYASHQGESDVVCQAISEQYLPAFSGDKVPSSAMGKALSMADKMDTLCGIFAVGKKPSGSKDPYALRRSALGIIHIMESIEQPINYVDFIQQTMSYLPDMPVEKETAGVEVVNFFDERLRQHLRDQAVDYDVVEAVLSAGSDNIVDIYKRIKSIEKFKKSGDTVVLVEANKRIVNLLRKSDQEETGSVDESLFIEPQEKALWQHIVPIKDSYGDLIESAEYDRLLSGLKELAGPVADYFDHVMVNVEETDLRQNRHSLLKQLGKILNSVAQINKLTLN